MDAEQALADLMEISTQVDAAVVLDEDGSVAASSLRRAEQAEALAAAAREALAAAEAAAGYRASKLTQLEAATREGTLFVVREAGRTVAATTACGPPAALVLYDLRTCLRAVDEVHA